MNEVTVTLSRDELILLIAGLKALATSSLGAPRARARMELLVKRLEAT